jgi:single-strand DNA-binding protein
MLNKIQIIGRLGKDPEVRYTPGGEAVCNFSVATSERWKDKATNEVKEETTWHRVSAWGRQAEIVGQYLVRGSLVYVEGKMTSRKYADKNGVEKESFEIRMQEMKMLSSREGGEQRQPQGQGPAPAQRPAAPAPAARPSSGFDDMDDDIPF